MFFFISREAIMSHFQLNIEKYNVLIAKCTKNDYFR